MKYYIIAGEASGDLHGSNLISELKKLDTAAEVRCWGGDKMAAAGGVLVKHYKDLAFMGFSEVLKNLPAIFRNLAFCKTDITQYRPDAVILIDYPGFNIRIAKWAKLQKFKVIFYISPQVWAWKESRVRVIKKYVDKMLVILPFESEFYRKWDYKVEYVGHPLVDIIDTYRRQNGTSTRLSVDQHQGSEPVPAHDSLRLNYDNRAGIIALLPGSRKQELKIKLPVMLKVAEFFPDHTFFVAKAPGIDSEFYDAFLGSHTNVFTVTGQTYNLLLIAKAALVTSGTATLETALFDVPQIVCYKGNALSYQIAKRIVKVKYISLVNLIMNRPVVKELIQDELTTKNLGKGLTSILTDAAERKRIQKDYAELKNILRHGGNASANAAAAIHQFVSA